MAIILDMRPSPGMLADHERHFTTLKRNGRTVLQTLRRPGLSSRRTHFRKLAFGPVAMFVQERQGSSFADRGRHDELDSFGFRDQTKMLGPSAMANAVRQRKA